MGITGCIMGNSPAHEVGPRMQKVLEKPHKDTGARERATVAGGCFWGLELAFQRVPGVVKTSVGYINGHMPNPNYEAVCTGRTGHAEAVDIHFDPTAVSYEELLEVFWDQHDPTSLNRQGNDSGTQYRSGIYVYSTEQRAIAEASKKEEAEKLGKPVVTEVVDAPHFYMAEGYHQQYLANGGQCASKGDNSDIRCYG